MIDSALKSKICGAILNTTPAKSIILFGSYARGEEWSESDIDLCVITDEDKNPFEIMTNIRLALYNIVDTSIDILVYTEAEFYERVKEGYFFEMEINERGVRFYGE